MIKYIRSNLQDWAVKIFEELESQPDDWFHPVSNKHAIFEQALMKFMNRNLNYFDHESMVATAVVEGDEWNPNLPVTVEFAKFVRTLTGKDDVPFGRMCAWKVPPGHTILPHRDDFTYHSMIVRHIFFVSKHPPGSIVVNINRRSALVDQGVLWTFDPAKDLHEFRNTTSDNFYFLGFDIYKPEILEEWKNKIDLDAVINNPVRLSGFGGPDTRFKYISRH